MLVFILMLLGFGYMYVVKEYIDGWILVFVFEGWMVEDIECFKVKCGKGGLIGCDNGW